MIVASVSVLIVFALVANDPLTASKCVQVLCSEQPHCARYLLPHLLKFHKILMAKYGKTKVPYDVVLDLRSAEDFGKRGVKLTYSKDRSIVLEKIRQARISIGVTGLFNVGKTFIIEEILGELLGSGFNIETVGLSATLSRNGKLLFFDTAGLQRSAGSSRVKDKLTTDLVIQELLIKLSNIVFYVVGPLRVAEQQDISRVCREMANEQSAKGKMLVVIHNFSEFGDPETVEKHIKSDIKEAFDGEMEENREGYPYFESPNVIDIEEGTEKHPRIKHVVLAKKGSKSGDKWNSKTISLLKEWIDAPARQRVPDFLEQLKQTLPSILAKFYYPREPKNFQEQQELICPQLGYVPENVMQNKNQTTWEWLKSFISAEDTKKQKAVLDLIKTCDEAFELDATGGDPSQGSSLVLKQQRDLTRLPFLTGLQGKLRYSPKVNFLQIDGTWHFSAELPGMKREDIFLMPHKSEQDTLLLIGGKPQQNRPRTRHSVSNYHAIHERGYNAFLRVIKLPNNIDTTKILEALQVNDGVLQVTLHRG